VLVCAQKDEEQGCTGERSCPVSVSVSLCLCLIAFNENRGPGFCSVTHQSAEINSTSLSKKGTEYFPSWVRGSILFQTDFQKPAPLLFQSLRETGRISQLESFGIAVLGSALSGSGVVQQPALYRGWTTGKSFYFTINKVGCLQHCNWILFSPRSFPKDFGLGGLGTHLPRVFNRNHVSKISFSPDRQKFSLTFLAPAIPPCKDPPSPGQYDLVDYKGSPKPDCSSAVFTSNTGRWTERPSRAGFPGPGRSKNCSEGSQSFLSTKGTAHAWNSTEL
uniref:Uncharacterized protein n=1 Tax=Falco tinnunculus TaxID=100819 RepID=A0A8C4TMV1_FALTI